MPEHDQAIFHQPNRVTDELLNLIVLLPTESLSSVATDGFFRKLTDANYRRIADLLAQKRHDEGAPDLRPSSSTTRLGGYLGKVTTHSCRKAIHIIMARPPRSGTPGEEISA